MCGLGPFMLAPGQPTDDSELAICLANGLTEKNESVLNIDCIAKYYGAWIDSPPFDIGNTTRSALGVLSSGSRLK